MIIEKRLHEINYGKYSGKKNNLELDKTRLKQIEGDYFVRLGEYGENNFDIEFRLCEFLNDVYVNNFKENTIMIVSHGSVISYMKRILNIKTPHIKTGKIEEFNNIEFSDSSFDMFLNGIGTKNLIQKKRSIFDNGIILICFYSNFENFAEKWMNHYINIGIRNFVLVDNNSGDNSTNILKNYEKKVSISFWKIEEEYNSYKMCG